MHIIPNPWPSLIAATTPRVAALSGPVAACPPAVAPVAALASRAPYSRAERVPGGAAR